MSIPSYSPDLDGILAIGAAPTPGAQWVPLVWPDTSGDIIRVDEDGNVTRTAASGTGPFVQFVISADGQTASIMPARDGGPKPNARWFNYGLMLVPVNGL